MIKRMFATLGMLLLATAVLVACSKVTGDNFAKINNDMSYDEVVQILGKPTSEQSLRLMDFGAKNAVWKHKGLTISIQFIDNKVKLKSMVNEGADSN